MAANVAMELFAKVASLLVGRFTVSFENELRFMAEMTGSAAAHAMRVDNVPQQVVRTATTALSRL
ncbi:hypothetical protein SPRG_05823 [Saprolegnia parasitica CBS 223.65]|uniref:Uncharacterized protein n=2 Tax=Saprolegnia parasitica (strain CBS 223.65) TaxID=695850 RepID=A0A067CRZ6_SAPPC|nr:hypothetical protein SPRG_05823 [Saprolegnia parasitica CBS 223.65]KDO29286.1 hypothetical protein SPRG_05823 [Saprolegnia parasitica CBS 223.65]|eukprot:XP_012199794.1 hypothetical protein SPRG_05823 [Saprolegnia parasitica CBS 223.65]